MNSSDRPVSGSLILSDSSKLLDLMAINCISAVVNGFIDKAKNLQDTGRA